MELPTTLKPDCSKISECHLRPLEEFLGVLVIAGAHKTYIEERDFASSGTDKGDKDLGLRCDL